ncbi:MAG: hypothetical protein ACI399_06765 [Candidatus Cryptobacteroides sp.]
MGRLLTIIAATVLLGGNLFAQGAISADSTSRSGEWKHAFSKEGVKDWKPEFTLRFYTGLVTDGPMLTGGVRIDEKRSLSLFACKGDTYLDYAPGSLYSICAGLNFRRYWHLGKNKVVSLYSDLYAGGGWIYKIDGKYHGDPDSGNYEEVIDDNVGDPVFIIGWQPGIRLTCCKNLHLFIGPTIATSCLGIHLGIGI